MSGDIVNLRQARKRRKRAEDESRAAQNRITFGRTKSEKQATSALNMLAEKRFEAGRREGSEPGNHEDGS